MLPPSSVHKSVTFCGVNKSVTVELAPYRRELKRLDRLNRVERFDRLNRVDRRGRPEDRRLCFDRLRRTGGMNGEFV